MLFQGKGIVCHRRDDGIAEIKFDLEGESVNKLNRATLDELDQAIAILEKESSLRGLLVTSGKAAFIVGADINEFLSVFAHSEEEIAGWLESAQAIANRLEDLPFPSVAVIGGYALGGGMEVAMAATYRVLSTEAVMGQPEVKLGIIPGFGGTVRLPRLIGVDNAIDLIASGREVRADEALKLGLAQAVVEPELLEEAALALLRQSWASGSWKKKAQVKRDPVLLNGIERIMAFTTAKGFVTQKAGPNYPAPLAAIDVMEKAAAEGREKALELEGLAFGKVAKTPAAASLVSIFHADQFLKRKSKGQIKEAREVKQAAVLGAGIMGGGIAYQSASKGTPIIMKDIRLEAVRQGLSEAARLLRKMVERGRIDNEQMSETLASIQGTLSYGDFGGCDVVVEAVVENPEVKKSVLAEVESHLSPNAVLATNTSTISIDSLAVALKRPENFCGMHFFNPVHRMPLVEVIRGKASSPETIATVVSYAQKMGKTPVVVSDCPGFLVNRILSPYMLAFQQLVMEGATIEGIDKAMEIFGWPMGPAHLTDVVGIDTACHAGKVMAESFGERAKVNGSIPNELLFKAGYLGQKNDKGYYRYAKDRKGRPQKSYDPAVMELLAPAIKGGGGEPAPEEIVERMMLPMIIEAARCLEEGIVETPMELDISMIYGLGFPPFRGGLLRHADTVGLAALVKIGEKYGEKSPIHRPTEQMKKLSEAGKGFYSEQ